MTFVGSAIRLLGSVVFGSYDEIILTTVDIDTVGILKQTKDQNEKNRFFHLLAYAMENVNEGVTITDLSDKFVYVNKAFCRLYGYTPDEIIGKRPTVLIPSGAVSKIFPLVTGTTRRGGWKGELINLRNDGTLFPIQLSTAPIHDDGGQLIGLVGVMEDITHRYSEKELEQKFHLLQSNSGSVRSMVDEKIAQIVLLD